MSPSLPETVAGALLDEQGRWLGVVNAKLVAMDVDGIGVCHPGGSLAARAALENSTDSGRCSGPEVAAPAGENRGHVLGEVAFELHELTGSWMGEPQRLGVQRLSR